ncbi:hypothetical protein B0A55_00583 [Friedmanniomyces simplex]|uniref:F-box domain-containing protein n=1 Tax=Friedmanniomyces simplex TaxID=329884 RepID=A0A4U0Y2Y6_9PEZI|nr:hypothetical protein B0A55_00583 [Friedmanniomyces simplex]
MADDPGPGPVPPLLRLPREVHMQILTYLLRQGDKIPMGPKELVPKMSKKRRTLEREIRSLRPPGSKPPKKKDDHFPAVLLVHSDLYLAGVMTFWSGNTFVFGECDKLRAFISLARSEASSNISSIELGEAYHFQDVVNPGWDHEKNEPHPKQCLRRPTDSYWNTWPHPDWPISLELLAKLPKLRRLNLHVGALDQVWYLPAHGANDWTWETYYDQDTPPKHKSSLYLRDQVLLSIPRETLDNLQSLKMTYYVLLFLLPSCGQVTLNAEVLPYTKDLHNGAWNDPPHRPDPAQGLRLEPEPWRLYQRWLEARAEVYWDDTVEEKWRVMAAARDPLGQDEGIDVMEEVVNLQWCSWAREWSGDNYGTSVGLVERLERPRSKQELAEEEAALNGAEEEGPGDASWQWHRKRKEADDDDAASGSKKPRLTPRAL